MNEEIHQNVSERFVYSSNSNSSEDLNSDDLFEDIMTAAAKLENSLHVSGNSNLKIDEENNGDENNVCIDSPKDNSSEHSSKQSLQDDSESGVDVSNQSDQEENANEDQGNEEQCDQPFMKIQSFGASEEQVSASKILDKSDKNCYEVQMSTVEDDLERSLSHASRKSSCSGANSCDTLDSLTSSELETAGSIDECDDFNDSALSENYSLFPRPKSYTLASTMSEREYVSEREKKDRFKKLTLERDKRPPVHSGFLVKLGGTGLTPKNWRKRWFVLRGDNCLYYYKNPAERPVGAVVLSNYLVTNSMNSGSRKFAFTLSKGGARTYTFAASTDQERKTWMKIISEASKSTENANSTPECNIHNVSIPALSIKDPDCHGYIWKQGQTHKTWKRRYSVLKSGSLYYYKDMSETTAIGVFNLHCYTVRETESSGRKYSIIAIPPQHMMRTYYFSMETEGERGRWLQAFTTSIGKADNEEV